MSINIKHVLNHDEYVVLQYYWMHTGEIEIERGERGERGRERERER